jgi:tRNA threonylcarbamoyl adenosine modification protein (Sua5/YciO/YrdC/YwlC family)
MLLEVNPHNPDERKILKIAEILQAGGVIIYPTDGVYALGCDIFNQQAVEKICRIRGLNPEKARLSFICTDISQIAEYATQIDNPLFKLLKRNLPGPFTFILKANNKVPKLLKNRKSEFGVRIPDNRIALDIVRQLGRPVLSASLKDADEEASDAYLLDPFEIHERYHKLVDLVVDGGRGSDEPSSVIDCTGSEPVIVRQGVQELLE